MSINGGCDCGNIQITWRTIDYSLVPRACQCRYCSKNSVAYVSKSATAFEVLVRNDKLYAEIRHGSNRATFHECTNCDQVVFVTALIDGKLYGALNANQLKNKFGFSSPVSVDLSALAASEKRERWRQNWCCPVFIKRTV